MYIYRDPYCILLGFVGAPCQVDGLVDDVLHGCSKGCDQLGKLAVSWVIRAAKDGCSDLEYEPSTRMQRVQSLQVPMKKFIMIHRMHEKVLSEAVLTDGASLGKGSYNEKMHLIAKANYKHNISGMRTSRYAAWVHEMHKICNIVREKYEACTNIMGVPKQLRPACLIDKDGNRLYQVVVYRCDGPLLKIGIVQEVFRGAVSKPASSKGDGILTKAQIDAMVKKNRALRVTRPSDEELPFEACSRVKIAPLQPSVDNQQDHWTADITKQDILDPSGLPGCEGVCFEVGVVKVVNKYPYVQLMLKPDTVQFMKAFEDILAKGCMRLPII